MIERFCIYSASILPKVGSGHLFSVPRDIASKQELYQAYAEGLHAPHGYFGDNWDAFEDCLLDLSWLSNHIIHIVHTNVPALPESDVQTYLDILATSAEEWSKNKTSVLASEYPEFIPHQLKVYFPADDGAIG